MKWFSAFVVREVSCRHIHCRPKVLWLAHKHDPAIVSNIRPFVSVGCPRISLFKAVCQVLITGRHMRPKTKCSVNVNPRASLACLPADFSSRVERAGVHIAGLDADEGHFIQRRKCVRPHSALAVYGYPEVHGKKVDWISHWHEEGYLSFNVRFTDGKNFSILCSPTIVTNVVDFSDVKTGDSVIIREYYKRCDED